MSHKPWRGVELPELNSGDLDVHVAMAESAVQLMVDANTVCANALLRKHDRTGEACEVIARDGLTVIVRAPDAVVVDHLVVQTTTAPSAPSAPSQKTKSANKRQTTTPASSNKRSKPTSALVSAILRTEASTSVVVSAPPVLSVIVASHVQTSSPVSISTCHVVECGVTENVTQCTECAVHCCSLHGPEHDRHAVQFVVVGAQATNNSIPMACSTSNHVLQEGVDLRDNEHGGGSPTQPPHVFVAQQSSGVASAAAPRRRMGGPVESFVPIPRAHEVEQQDHPMTTRYGFLTPAYNVQFEAETIDMAVRICKALRAEQTKAVVRKGDVRDVEERLKREIDVYTNHNNRLLKFASYFKCDDILVFDRPVLNMTLKDQFTRAAFTNAFSEAFFERYTCW